MSSPPPVTPSAVAKRPEPTFIDFLQQIDENRFASQITEEMEVLIEQLKRIAQIPNTKPKGRLTIELTIAAQPGGEIMSVTPSVKVKIPKPPASTSTFWRTKANMLSAVSPQQIGLPFEDVSSARKGDVTILK